MIANLSHRRRDAPRGEIFIVALILVGLMSLALTSVMIMGQSHRKGLLRMKELQHKIHRIHQGRITTEQEWSVEIQLLQNKKRQDHIYIDTRP